MKSSHLYRTRLGIVMSFISLLFLVPEFTIDFIFDYVEAQTPHCNLDSYDALWCNYERQVENQPNCIKIWTEYNRDWGPISESLIQDVSERCPPPQPPNYPPLNIASEVYDCKKYNTCPTEKYNPCRDPEMFGAYPGCTFGPKTKEEFDMENRDEQDEIFDDEDDYFPPSKTPRHDLFEEDEDDPDWIKRIFPNYKATKGPPSLPHLPGLPETPWLK